MIPKEYAFCRVLWVTGRLGDQRYRSMERPCRVACELASLTATGGGLFFLGRSRALAASIGRRSTRDAHGSLGGPSRVVIALERRRLLDPAGERRWPLLLPAFQEPRGEPRRLLDRGAGAAYRMRRAASA